ncbi:sensor histidine kinase [Pseudokordiimonas caeni]|uniref:sensor histidine kinase n=1 Tax=Pseudokordiimonas caeni TaxID=2997908 RepID=UPI0028127974|nr:HAMP domain-containing sensor histidine kinase [Pseudokordiimonas caeni]
MTFIAPISSNRETGDSLVASLSDLGGMSYMTAALGAIGKAVDARLVVLMPPARAADELAVSLAAVDRDGATDPIKFRTLPREADCRYMVTTEKLATWEAADSVYLSLEDADYQPLGYIIALTAKPATHKMLVDAVKSLGLRFIEEVRQLEQLARLELALQNERFTNQAKSIFMANISREIRNPLSAIIGYASLLKGHELPPEEIHEFALEIAQTGEQLLALISDILDLSTLDLSSGVAKQESFDLSEVARAARRIMLEQAASRHLDFPGSERGEPLWALGDMEMTRKAVLVLVSNAIKYTNKGEVRIDLEERPGGEVALIVRDTGVGMTAEELKQVTTPIGALDTAYSVHSDGSGLGLPLSFLFAERQGARIVIDSEKGVGTSAAIIFQPGKAPSSDEDSFI